MFSKQLGRFLLVGGSNALLHFMVLNATYTLLNTSKLAASIIATLFAMCYSFILNKSFVFKSRDSLRREVIWFVGITITGMLLIHNFVFALCTNFFENQPSLLNLISNLSFNVFTNDILIINISTVVGAIFALIWNYNGYRLFVFNKLKRSDEAEAEKY
jgi:putative flippase GtrA